MRSFWTVSHVGAHTATTLKKLERLLGIKALDVQRERYVWEGENLERAAFFVEHGPLAWEALVVSLMQKTSLLASAWQTSGDATHTLCARVLASDTRSQFWSGVPSGLREISWEARVDQQFSGALIAAGSTALVRW
jgi:hypothetical protein